MRETQNYFAPNPPTSRSRAGGRGILRPDDRAVGIRDFAPKMIRHVFREDMLSAVLPGIAHRARSLRLGDSLYWGILRDVAIPPRGSIARRRHGRCGHRLRHV